MSHHTPLPRTQRLTLTAPASPAILERVAAIRGIGTVQPLGDGRQVALSYDLQIATLAELEPQMIAAGLALSDRALHRWSRAWAAFQDDNIRSHSRLRHQCCCTPPDDRT
ncbi:hypothetical protein [Magnetospirillum molischianum]|uniref:Uncharacterized protein n=1 Tax=Magnetospirillum molischianum DSM 120 TaxID=1150626 RepID=H8FQZ1_MAGML|nr:hypothetical protein [Magnetospirillum molischianum]CCG40779.1 conserved hypothetical protein [Magnetospirillum molischianum DSM 120]